MTSTRIVVALAFAAALVGCGSASAGESCFSRAQTCEAIRTPARVARYYSDNPDRCSASCTPRFYRCLQTGVWVHLEDDRPALREEVDPF